MLDTILQIWSGGFYLLNKVFFSFAERSNEVRKRVWRIRSWSVYLIGLPAWVIIFISERNWIAAALEAGGAPSMLLGLVIAIRGKGREPKWINYVAVVSIVIGLSYSLYDFGGLTTVNQLLELSIVFGFLVGTYLLARERSVGYVLFMLMNVSCGTLMYVQGYPWLLLQQIISLGFVVDAYRNSRKK